MTAAMSFGQTIQLSAGRTFSSVFLPSPPKLSPDSRWAVYAQDAVTDNASELWSVRADGSAHPVRLSRPLVTGQFVTFQVSSDSARVVYMTDQDTRGMLEVYSVPISGGTITKLNPNLLAGRSVANFAISPTSERVFYLADQHTVEMGDLYSVPTIGGAAVRLNASLPFDNDVRSFLVSPNGARVVYSQGRDATGVWSLWSVPALGGAATRISRSGSTTTAHYEISSDSTTVIYSADATEPGFYDLYVAPIGGGTSTRIDRADGRSVRSFVLRGSTVIYNVGSQWYSVALTGGPSVEVSAPQPLPVTSPDGQWTVYPVGSSLWSEGPGGQRRVSCGGQVVQHTYATKPTYSVSGDSRSVLYVADGELWAGPISGSVCEIFNDGFNDGTTEAWR